MNLTYRTLQLSSGHWASQLTFAGVISAIAIGVRLARPSATIAEAAVVTWLTFYLATVAMWIVVCFGELHQSCQHLCAVQPSRPSLMVRPLPLAIWLAITILVYLDRSNRRQIFLTSLYTSISYLIWSILLSGIFEVCLCSAITINAADNAPLQVIFEINPFPRNNADGTESELDYDKIWWLRRLFIVNWFVAGLL